MKNLNVLTRSIFISLPTLLFIMLPGCSASEGQNNFQDNAQREYNIQDLNEYGEWITINNYSNIWHPYAVNSWIPYDNGHWVYSNSSWMWISYEPFGWIVYHYGEWYDDPFYGWVWITTDNIWSPANVRWVTYGDYICWVPLGPCEVHYGNPWEQNQTKYWHIVKASDFTKDNIRDYRIIEPVRNENGRDVITHQPERMFLEKNTGKAVPEINVQREQVKVSNRNMEKMSLPKEENKRVEQNIPRIRKEVLMPRDEFHKQRSVRNQSGERTK